MVAGADFRKRAIFAEEIAGFADRSDDIRVNGAAGFFLHGNDLVKGIIESGTNEIVHRGIDNDEVFAASAFHVFNASDKNSGVTGNEPARLEQDADTKGFEERQETLRVFFWREEFRGIGTAPPFFRTAGEGVLVTNAESTADTEELESIFRGELFEERGDFLNGRFERIHFGELRSDVHLEPAQVEILEFRRARVDPFDLFVSDAEFIFVRAGGDLGVRAGIDVWIHTDGNRRA